MRLFVTHVPKVLRCAARWKLPEDLRSLPVVSTLLDSGDTAAPTLRRLREDAAGVMHVTRSQEPKAAAHLQKCAPHPPPQPETVTQNETP